MDLKLNLYQYAKIIFYKDYSMLSSNHFLNVIIVCIIFN